MNRWQKGLSALVHYGGYVCVPGTRRHGFTHMPMSVGRAVWDTALSKAAYRKIEDGFFRDNLIVVIGPGKSGTRNLCEVSCVLSDAYGPSAPPWKRPFRNGWVDARYMTWSADLQIESVIDVIDGGVLHSHSGPNYRSLRVLETLGSKAAIMARNPLHQLVARYTQCLYEINRAPEIPIPRHFMDAAYPVPSAVFDGNRNTDEVIGFMIRAGYLEAQLNWIATWLELRDPERSIAVTLEDMKEPSGKVFERLCRFLFDRPIDPEILQRCQAVVETTTDRRRRESGSYHLPRGTSRTDAEVMAYVSDENHRAYKEVVSRFIGAHPLGPRLLEVFPYFADLR